MKNKNLMVIYIILILVVANYGFMPAQADSITHFVKQDATGGNDGSSWIDAYTDLQSALSASSSGDEIWVAAGTYKPTTGADRTIPFTLKNGVAIYGGFNGTETLLGARDFEANVTVLSGDIGIVGDNSDNSYHVVDASGTNNNALLDGFTVKAGNADNLMYASDSSKGGGIYNELGSPTMKNLIVNENHATFGGGMYNHGDPFYNQGKYYFPILTNIVFSNNSAIEGGGMRNDYYSNPVLTNVSFDNNVASRGGGGMENFDFCSPTLVNVTFNNNTAAAGGGMMNWNGNNPILTNVTFYGNSADWDNGIDSGGEGGGIYNSISNPTLTNVTFSSNSAHLLGGGLYNTSNSNADIHNTILWGNTAPDGAQIYDISNTSAISDSVIQDGYAGGTNIITTDPKLGTLGDYGGFTETIPLQAESSAIDVGNDVNCPSTDQRGVARLFGSHCDIGAYEFTGDALSPSSIDFGEQLFRTSSAAERVTVNNIYSSDITLGTLQGSNSVGTTWVSSKSFFIENDACSGAVLSSGESCTFNVKFLPWQLGAKTGTITIPSNAPDAPYVLSLSGNSIAGSQLLFNRSFENFDPITKIPKLWSATPTFKTGLDGIDSSWAAHGTYSVKLVGDGDLKVLSQQVDKAGVAGDDFSFFVVTHGNNIPVDSSRWLLQIMFYNGSTIVENRNVNLQTGTYDYKLINRTYTAANDYTHIVFRIHFGKSSGTAWVDLASLQWAP